MIEGLDADVVGTDAAATRRDEVVARVTDHAGRMARELSLLQGGDYGERAFETDRGTWTLKYEAGDVQYLRFADGRTETYVVSTQQPPDPEALADAMTDYANFVTSFNEYVKSLDGILADVPTEFPDVASTETVVAEREGILEQLWESANAMAGELHRYRGSNYGTFETRVDGTRWELNWEGGRAEYLRVGGESGIYLLSQYEPPSVRDLRAHVPEFRAFVDAFNEHVDGISAELQTVSLE